MATTAKATAKPFRPTLALGDATWDDFKRLIESGETYYASPKLDGIRCIIRDGVAVSRTLKPIRNRYIQSCLGKSVFNGFDGELIVGAMRGEGVFQRTTSGVMSEFGEPDFRFYVFDDCYMPYNSYYDRLLHLDKTINGRKDSPYIQLLQQTDVPDLEALERLEQMWVDEGYEGAILRWAGSPYKQGRSTLRERYMLKLKRFLDSEAQIIGFEELQHNDNEAIIDDRGYTVRSSHKDKKRGGNTLGKIRVQDIHRSGWEFSIGSGFDADLRSKIWQSQPDYLGRIVKYKYLPIGTLDLPRHPIFLGFRDPIDVDFHPTPMGSDLRQIIDMAEKPESLPP